MAINNVVLTGNITKDIELKQTQSGKSVVNISLAVTRRFNKEETDFFELQLWGKVAELAEKYLSKGSKIGVVGAIQQQRWEKDGKKQSKIIINVDQLEFLDNKKKEESNGNNNDIDSSDEFPW